MENEKIGYANPPKEHQFKPGQSGNKTGRPIGSKSTYKILDDICNQKIQITQDGKPLRISKREMMFLQTTNKAIKGDIKAFQTLLPHLLIIDAKNEERAHAVATLRQDDQKIIETFMKGSKNGNE